MGAVLKRVTSEAGLVADLELAADLVSNGSLDLATTDAEPLKDALARAHVAVMDALAKAVVYAAEQQRAREAARRPGWAAAPRAAPRDARRRVATASSEGVYRSDAEPWWVREAREAIAQAKVATATQASTQPSTLVALARDFESLLELLMDGDAPAPESPRLRTLLDEVRAVQDSTKAEGR